ncbi:MAG TPA: bifunctional adenosylcobinamide kinase/adenosylcobinamide-phosphate guanylyltransferase [Rhizobacter sp.]|nr:bifunctional adenosylcobinamide kinase/adenosylcobinamide-phosphate guanylyltransferase [Rhizobacter sp.]
MAGTELILGGQRSGKSRCAEQRAAAWLRKPGHSAMLVATALGHDDEMRERIARHRADRAPGLQTEEVPHDLPDALRRLSAPQRLLVVDCLTLWATNLLMPLGASGLGDAAWQFRVDELCAAIERAAGPVVLVSNEIGLGVSPLSPEARRFIDELGRMHQAVAARCEAVTLMVAGIEMPVKRRVA